MTSSECVHTLSTTSEQKCAAHIILRDVDLQEVRSYYKYINATAVNVALYVPPVEYENGQSELLIIQH